ncbi:MAG TPA: exodeoxyribonuclease VII small subunit [Planctomycetota bacterium]|nr:exodeoxyribonuclease VII small subunit [Planctomycetota bacterium]
MAAARSARSASADGAGAKPGGDERPDPRELQGHFDRLEEIADALGSPDTPLDQGLKLYGEGVELLRKTKAIIEEARRQIQLLDEDAKGNPIVLPWDEDADDDDDEGGDAPDEK